MFVLIADDDAFMRAYIGNCLQGAGYSFVAVSNGQEALDVLDQRRADLVITDLDMPVLDGFELIARLAVRHDPPPLIALTGLGGAAARLPGKLVCLEKPVNGTVLIEEVRKALEAAAGRVRGISLPGFLQVLNWEKKSCTLVIRSQGHEGRVFVSEGEIHDAASDQHLGLAAALEILSWDAAEIAILSAQERPRTINAPLMELVMESARVKDEATEGAAQGAPAAVLHLSNGFGEASRAILDQLSSDVSGLLLASLIDLDSGAIVAASGPGRGLDLRLAGDHAREIVRLERHALHAMHSTSTLDDIVLTLSDQWHVIKTLSSSTILYLVTDRSISNLALVRSTTARYAPELMQAQSSALALRLVSA